MMRLALPILLLWLAACDRPSPEEKARQDARDVAMVEAAQKVQPPVQRLGPQPIPQIDIDRYGLTAPGCSFVPAGAASPDPVLLAGDVRGFLKIGENIVILAADRGSPALPHGGYEKYSGRGHWLQLTRGEGGGEVLPGSLTVRDKFDRVVYFSAGQLTCRG